jgi:AraC-like DNA-binding protein
VATQTLLDQVSTLLDQSGVAQGALAHAPSGVHMLRFSATTGQDASVYRPLLCLVLQGAKEVGTQAKTLKVADGQSLLVSHALPVVSRITEAARDRPYVALVLPLDMDLLRALAPDVTPALGTSAQDTFSISLCSTDLEMEGALLRYLRQCEHEDARRLLAPITRREIHARLLMGSHAEPLQKLLWHETSASRIFQATRAIQSDLSRPLTIGDLARQAAMSSSAFFQHFKAVTGTSPLQYQKELRLLHARDALRNSNEKVSDIAFRVGYDSASQFSREYTRKFGRPPKVDRGRPAAA